MVYYVREITAKKSCKYAWQVLIDITFSVSTCIVPSGLFWVPLDEYDQLNVETGGWKQWQHMIVTVVPCHLKRAYFCSCGSIRNAGSPNILPLVYGFRSLSRGCPMQMPIIYHKTISLWLQMVGVWCVNEWSNLYAGKPIQVVELGPGRGTLAEDLLRVRNISISEFVTGQSWMT